MKKAKTKTTPVAIGSPVITAGKRNNVETSISADAATDVIPQNRIKAHEMHCDDQAQNNPVVPVPKVDLCFCTIEEVAQQLCVTARTIKSWQRRRLIPFRKIKTAPCAPPWPFVWLPA